MGSNGICSSDVTGSRHTIQEKLKNYEDISRQYCHYLGLERKSLVTASYN